jgi:hypothetical protein
MVGGQPDRTRYATPVANIHLLLSSGRIDPGQVPR